jgi:hypothetical protein
MALQDLHTALWSPAVASLPAKPPLLAIWGKNDPFFIPAGAEAFRKDIPGAEIQFLDTGHFALETRRNFLGHKGLPRNEWHQSLRVETEKVCRQALVKCCWKTFLVAYYRRTEHDEHDLCDFSLSKTAAASPRPRNGVRGGGRGRPDRTVARQSHLVVPLA